MLSIIVPAYNEERYLSATLSSIRAALEPIPGAELIVVDNQSTDATGEIARQFEARVVSEIVRNISRVRNTGAAAARGNILAFIDADTIVRPGLFEKVISEMADENCLGGGVDVEYERPLRRTWVLHYLSLAQAIGRWLKLRQGAMQFCRTTAFRKLGGYDETIYIGEDVEFQWRLDRLARRTGGRTAFIDSPKVLTSFRRFSQMSLLRTIILTHPITILLAWRIRSVWKDWYENAVR